MKETIRVLLSEEEVDRILGFSKEDTDDFEGVEFE